MNKYKNNLKTFLNLKPHISNQHYNLVCILTDKTGKILSIGYNSMTKTHPFHSQYAIQAGHPLRSTLHAETHALSRCSEIPYMATVYRLRSSGLLGLARPCEICMLALRKNGVQKLQYSTNEQTFIIEDL